MYPGNRVSLDLVKDHVDQISDDFQSTFSHPRLNTLTNMLQGDHEFPVVEAIIKKHCGDVVVEFQKTNAYDDGPYDIYLIKVKPRGV
jgi:hypothetical protein